jgi:hypothetical protein
MRPHLQKKKNQSKMDWRCGSSSQCLLYKHKTLSSNSSPTKKKKKKKRKGKERKGREGKVVIMTAYQIFKTLA